MARGKVIPCSREVISTIRDEVLEVRVEDTSNG
jgi:hypothetical protein